MIVFGIGIIIYMNKQSKSTLQGLNARGYILGIGLIIIGGIDILKMFNLIT